MSETNQSNQATDLSLGAKIQTVGLMAQRYLTIEDAFPGMAPQTFNDEWWRAQDPRIRAFRDMTFEARVAAAIALLNADPTVKIDWPIAVSEMEGTPYLTTQQRMIDGMKRAPIAKLFTGIFVARIYSIGGNATSAGTVDINSLGDADSFPVPPDLTPWPDPVLPKANEFVGPEWDAGRKLYVATQRGWQAPEGQILQEADGHFYKRIGQLAPGDPIAQYQRLD